MLKRSRNSPVLRANGHEISVSLSLFKNGVCACGKASMEMLRTRGSGVVKMFVTPDG